MPSGTSAHCPASLLPEPADYSPGTQPCHTVNELLHKMAQMLGGNRQARDSNTRQRGRLPPNSKQRLKLWPDKAKMLLNTNIPFSELNICCCCQELSEREAAEVVLIFSQTQPTESSAGSKLSPPDAFAVRHEQKMSLFLRERGSQCSILPGPSPQPRIMRRKQSPYFGRQDLDLNCS